MARKSRTDAQFRTQMAEVGWRAAFYGRLSVEDGDDIEQNSIGNQKMIVQDDLKRRGDMTLVDTFVDHGYTGMNYDRPEFQRMMEAISAGNVNCVIVKDVSRLGRNFILTSELVEKTFPQMGVRLICLGDDYDSEDMNADASSLMLPFKMVMNDSYARDISKKIRSSIHTKMNRGEFLPAAGSVPYGYIRNAQSVSYDVDPEAACVVVRIYEMRASGQKLNEIAKRLNDEGVPCPGRLRFLRGSSHADKNKSAIWQRRTIGRITQDVVYTGRRVHGRLGRDSLGKDKKSRNQEDWTVIEHAHPPIISETLFERVQKVNREERAIRAAYRPTASVGLDYRSIFRGKIYCAQCGSRMVPAKGCARRGAKTPSRVFYDCNTYRTSAHTLCSSHYIRQETIMSAVKNVLDLQLQVAVDLEQLIREIRSSPLGRGCERDDTEELLSIRARKRSIEDKMERLLRDLMDGNLDREEYAYMKAAYREQLAALSQKEKKAQEENLALSQALNTSQAWLENMMKYRKLPHVDRELMELLIDRIVVGDDKRVMIELRCADPLAKLQIMLDQHPEGKTHAG
ncbi:MAG: recombinase family protein [Candidatus Ventricola sp.]